MPTSKPGTFLPRTWTCKWAGASSRPHTWLRHITPLPATCHGNYIPRDSIQLDQTLPKKFALALFTGLVMATLFLILWPCRKIFGWTSFGNRVMTEKEATEGFDFYKRRELRSVSASLFLHLLSKPVKRCSWFSACFWFRRTRQSLTGWNNAANEVFWLRNKAKLAQAIIPSFSQSNIQSKTTECIFIHFII